MKDYKASGIRHQSDNLTREFVLKAVSHTGISQGRTWYAWDSNGVHFISA